MLTVFITGHVHMLTSGYGLDDSSKSCTGSVSANTEGDAQIIVMSTISSRVWLAVDVHVRQSEQLIMPDGTQVTDGSGNAFEI